MVKYKKKIKSVTTKENNKTVLIIDEDPLSVKLTVDLLELNGINTLSSNTWQGALEVLKNTVPALILLDINMSKDNSLEVYNNIRQASCFNQVKVIALSASVMKEDEERIKSAGLDAFIPKPIDIKNFVNKIKTFIQE